MKVSTKYLNDHVYSLKDIINRIYGFDVTSLHKQSNKNVLEYLYFDSQDMYEVFEVFYKALKDEVNNFLMNEKLSDSCMHKLWNISVQDKDTGTKVYFKDISGNPKFKLYCLGRIDGSTTSHHRNSKKRIIEFYMNIKENYFNNLAILNCDFSDDLSNDTSSNLNNDYINITTNSMFGIKKFDKHGGNYFLLKPNISNFIYIDLSPIRDRIYYIMKEKFNIVSAANYKISLNIHHDDKNNIIDKLIFQNIQSTNNIPTMEKMINIQFHSYKLEQLIKDILSGENFHIQSKKVPRMYSFEKALDTDNSGFHKVCDDSWCTKYNHEYKNGVLDRNITLKYFDKIIKNYEIDSDVGRIKDSEGRYNPIYFDLSMDGIEHLYYPITFYVAIEVFTNDKNSINTFSDLEINFESIRNGELKTPYPQYSFGKLCFFCAIDLLADIDRDSMLSDFYQYKYRLDLSAKRDK